MTCVSVSCIKCRMFIKRDWAHHARLVHCLLFTLTLSQSYTHVHASRRCNDWKWNKNQNSLEITYTDRPLTQSYERAIVVDLFFSSNISTTINSSTITATHVVAAINAVATVSLPCVFHLFFSVCMYMYVFRELTFQAHVKKRTATTTAKQQTSK